MIEEIMTNVVRCDGHDCFESYADTVYVRADLIEKFALRDGWKVARSKDHDDQHFCPACAILLGAALQHLEGEFRDVR